MRDISAIFFLFFFFNCARSTENGDAYRQGEMKCIATTNKTSSDSGHNYSLATQVSGYCSLGTQVYAHNYSPGTKASGHIHLRPKCRDIDISLLRIWDVSRDKMKLIDSVVHSRRIEKNRNQVVRKVLSAGKACKAIIF